jgi:hypothetical protein
VAEAPERAPEASGIESQIRANGQHGRVVAEAVSPETSMGERPAPLSPSGGAVSEPLGSPAHPGIPRFAHARARLRNGLPKRSTLAGVRYLAGMRRARLDVDGTMRVTT